MGGYELPSSRRFRLMDNDALILLQVNYNTVTGEPSRLLLCDKQNDLIGKELPFV